MSDIKRCCFCGRQFTGFGNNPRPVNDEGECCDECNIQIVIPERIKRLKETRRDADEK